MKHIKQINFAILLACIVILFAACTERKDYKSFVEQELIPTLERLEQAYNAPDDYIKTTWDDDIIMAMVYIELFLDGDKDTTEHDAERALEVINDYINYSREELDNLLKYTRKYYLN